MKWAFMLLLATLIMSGSFFSAGAAENCVNSIVATTPDSSFTFLDDGTVIHTATGLMWMRCSLGQNWDGRSCSGSAATLTWQESLQAASGKKLAGHTDWRVPSKNDLESIVEERCKSPAINAHVFPATPPSYFWTSSPYAALGQGAWAIDFGYGAANATVKSGTAHVRLVRGGR